MQIRHFGLCEYVPIWQQMRAFTRHRTPTTEDEIWLLQHHPVYTQGTRGHAQPQAAGRAIPLIHTDRGGLITYHGPGQLIAYLLFDLKRHARGVKSLVQQSEQWIIELLQYYGVEGLRQPGAPGVYVGAKKIAALGLRITRGCCYHGLSINIAMDLQPYDWIQPCGFPNLQSTQLTDHIPQITFAEAQTTLQTLLTQNPIAPYGGR